MATITKTDQNPTLSTTDPEQKETIGLRAQLEQLSAQVAHLQSIVAEQNPTKLRKRPYVRVASCVELRSAGTKDLPKDVRHTVTRAMQVKENVDGEMHTMLKRKCEGCGTIWIVKDYGPQ